MTNDELLREAKAAIESLEAIISGEISRDWADSFYADWSRGDSAKSRIDARLATGGWIPVSERMPTKEDADNSGNVLHTWDGMESVVTAHWTRVCYAAKQLDPIDGHVWQPLPPLPKKG